MKILYAALKHDPTEIDAASSVDYGFYTQLKRCGAVEVIGPFKPKPILIEKAFKRFYRRVSSKRYMKWDLELIWRVSREVNRLVVARDADVLFTMFPVVLARYNQAIPSIFVTDLAFQSWQKNGANFGAIPLRIQVELERQAVTRCSRVLAHSQWCKDELVNSHHIPPDKVDILTMPSALPLHVVPDVINIRAEKKLEEPLRLLLVGRVYHRKGIDIAIEVVKQLNATGTPAELTVVGLSAEPEPFTTFAGLYRKSMPEELDQYIAHYRRAHLLIHPARFEPAGIVPGEAAAFGTPTITNDTGGLGTTVKHNVSGIVLSKDSPAQDYVTAIKRLIANPAEYYRLCESTRARYEQELNWDVAGKQVASILEQVIAGHKG